MLFLSFCWVIKAAVSPSRGTRGTIDGKGRRPPVSWQATWAAVVTWHSCHAASVAGKQMSCPLTGNTLTLSSVSLWLDQIQQPRVYSERMKVGLRLAVDHEGSSLEYQDDSAAFIVTDVKMVHKVYFVSQPFLNLIYCYYYYNFYYLFIYLFLITWASFASLWSLVCLFMRGFALHCCSEVTSCATICCLCYFFQNTWLLCGERCSLLRSPLGSFCVNTRTVCTSHVVSLASMTHSPGQRSYLILLLFSHCVKTRGRRASMIFMPEEDVKFP